MSDSHFIIYPEVPGEWGRKTLADVSVHPPIVKQLHVLLHGWLGGDILTIFPSFFITESLKAAMQEKRFTGVGIEEELEVEPSDQFQAFYPVKVPPRLFLLEIYGTPGIDDLGLTSKSNLVISSRFKRFLDSHNLGDATFQPYQGEG